MFANIEKIHNAHKKIERNGATYEKRDMAREASRVVNELLAKDMKEFMFN